MKSIAKRNNQGEIEKLLTEVKLFVYIQIHSYCIVIDLSVLNGGVKVYA